MIIKFNTLLFAILLDYHGPLLKYITKVCKGVFSAILLMFVVQNETWKIGQN